MYMFCLKVPTAEQAKHETYGCKKLQGAICMDLMTYLAVYRNQRKGCIFVAGALDMLVPLVLKSREHEVHSHSFI